MRRFNAFLKVVAPAAVLFLGLGADARANFVTNLYDTGTTTSTTAGSSLAAQGAADANYSLSSALPNASTAYVQNANSIPGTYTADTATSQWINPSANGANYATGTLTFTTTFSIGSAFSSASLSGQVAADDAVTVYLNGTAISPVIYGFNTFSSFSDTNLADFKVGTNTLTFVVTNLFGSTPTALQVNALAGSYTPSAVPEPASMLMMAIGGVAVFGFARFRRARTV